jgi:thioredoxin-related protein
MLVLSFLSIKNNAQEAQIEWLSFEEAVARKESEPRKLLIDIYTDWCGWCKKMDKTTYADPKVIELINTYFYPVKLNAEQKTPITFDNHTFNFVASGRRGYHQLAAALTNNKLSYPTTVFLTRNNEIIQVLPGYMTAENILPILEYFGADHFRSTPWTEFQEKYANR